MGSTQRRPAAAVVTNRLVPPNPAFITAAITVRGPAWPKHSPLRHECMRLNVAGLKSAVAAQEIDRESSQGHVTQEQLRHMPYTEACVKEALRLYPPATALARELTQDMQIMGHSVPKGTGIFVSPPTLAWQQGKWSSAGLPQEAVHGAHRVMPRGLRRCLPFLVPLSPRMLPGMVRGTLQRAKAACLGLDNAFEMPCNTGVRETLLAPCSTSSTSACA